jgi:hypothetical protein
VVKFGLPARGRRVIGNNFQQNISTKQSPRAIGPGALIKQPATGQ